MDDIVGESWETKAASSFGLEAAFVHLRESTLKV
jgi:hypothetical protein